MAIYLLRHGCIEFDGSATGGPKRFLGQTDIKLSQVGREQARAWQTELADKAFDGIYASDLARCAETAGIIAERRPVEVQLIPKLREIHLGKLEGLSMESVRMEFPDEWKERGDSLPHYRPEGGESFADLRERVLPVFETIVRKHKGNILIVSHAGVNRIILCHILGMPLSNLFRIGQAHGCLNIVETYKDSFRVMRLNQVCPYP